jgi:glutamate decarboxylase
MRLRQLLTFVSSNFSRPGAQIIAQYYNLIHLGFNGFRDIMENTLRNARGT